MNTYKLTVAQALVKFLDNQYIKFDGKEEKFVEGIFTIFGHGIAIGLAEALENEDHSLKIFQGRNEQGMCHAAIGFAKQNNRRKIIACSSSIGPGAANMVTAAATATVNNIPLLLFPADTFSSRQPDPVLQQIENPTNLTITTNDAFKPVCKYWDRINRPEQLMSAMINALRVLCDPAETGAVCISLPQDCEGETYDYPYYFFKKRVHKISRILPIKDEIDEAIEIIKKSKKPLIIVGGGVKYSEAHNEVENFCNKFNIPFSETQSGKSACKSSNKMCLGGIGTTGTLPSNNIAKNSDCIIALGTRLSDFTTASKSQFTNAKIINININKFHAYKMDSIQVVSDVKEALLAIEKELSKLNYISSYKDEIKKEKEIWNNIVNDLKEYSYDNNFSPIIKYRDLRTIPEFTKMTKSTLTQTSAILNINELIDEKSIIITAGGSLPSCLQRLWTTDTKDAYHAEYGYSCMGYECSAILGVKLARPDYEVYTLVGDGSFQMLHSEMATIMQENLKVIIILFDNCGFGCINNLEMSNGVGSVATEFRKRDENNKLLGNLLSVDYAKIAEGYGFKTYKAKTKEELKNAIINAKKDSLPVLIDLKVIPKTMTDGYNTFWNIGLAEKSKKNEVNEIFKKLKEKRKLLRKY